MGSGFGPVFLNGRMRYTSASAIKKFRACKRAWGFRYLVRLPDPPSKNAQLGKQGHSRLEHYYKTGERTLGTAELAGAHLLPQPGPLIRAELRFEVDHPATPRVAGVPIAGLCDIMNASGQTITPDGRTEPSPVEILDFKFSGDPRRWGLSPAKVREEFQMNSYALAAINAGVVRDHPDEPVRLSHLYFSLKRPDSFKRSTVTDVRRVRLRVLQETDAVEEMKALANCSDPNQIEPNTDACGNFGGCSFAEHCVLTKSQHIQALMGRPLHKGKKSVEDTQKRMQELAAAQAAAAAPAFDAQYALKVIQAANMGTPMFGGAAAEALGAAPNTGLAGSGQLGQATISTVEAFQQYSQEMLKYLADNNIPIPARTAAVAAPTPAPPPVPTNFDAAAVQNPTNPPLVPPGNPPPTFAQSAVQPPPAAVAGAAPSLQQVVAQHAAAQAAEAPATPAEQVTDAGAPAGENPLAEVLTPTGRVSWQKTAEKYKDIILAQDAPAPDVQEVNALREEIKFLTGELTKAQTGQAPAAPAAPVAAEGPTIYVDCLVNGETRGANLRPVIDGMIDDIKSTFNARTLTAEADGALGYGKWREMIEARVVGEPPPAGTYYLMHAQSEVCGLFLAALTKVGFTVARGI